MDKPATVARLALVELLLDIADRAVIAQHLLIEELRSRGETMAKAETALAVFQAQAVLRRGEREKLISGLRALEQVSPEAPTQS